VTANNSRRAPSRARTLSRQAPSGARTPTHLAIDAVWRIESARIIAGLARIVRDIGVAEELAQDALVAALEQWPKSGVPDNPGAWLMATAKHRAIDLLRRNKRQERKYEEIGREIESKQDMAVADLEAAIDDDVGDDLLRLLFISCHPVLTSEARVALTLRLLGGLTTDEIARAFLVPEPTIAQRIVRAKRTLAEAHVPFEVPRGDELAARLSSVSTKAIRRRRATIGCGPRSAKRRCASAESWPSSLQRNRRFTGSSRSWRFKRRVRARGRAHPESLSCCSIKTVRAGINF
jgi:RNA polymerase sigma factor (sigma-70 family)